MPIRHVRVGEVFRKSNGVLLQVIAYLEGTVYFHNGSSYPITVVDTAEFELVEGA